MASGLLMLLDDIASLLDDVAVLTKISVKKTAGVLGDDLALNAQQVTGVSANRELPVVWAVAKGSLINKAILVPAALALSAAAPWSITPLMIAGGAFLCFEGCEKLAHKFLHSAAEDETRKDELMQAIAKDDIDIVAHEKAKVRGAIRTDFILSAEIIVITLGTIGSSPAMTRFAVLVAISLLMTIGVYGLVAGIVKLDDLGAHLIATNGDNSSTGLRRRIGQFILTAAPYLMKFLSIAGTIAMFLVGGGILVHGVPTIHHAIAAVTHKMSEMGKLGAIAGSATSMVLEGLVGIAIGAVILLVVVAFKRLRGKSPSEVVELDQKPN